MAEAVGVSKNTVIAWEKGESSPNAVQLSGLSDIGIDVLYVVTGSRSLNALAPDESTLLTNFRTLKDEQKAAVVHVSEAFASKKMEQNTGS